MRGLNPQQAAARYPVRLRGVVVGEAEPDGEAVVIYDGSEAIYLRGPRVLLSPISRSDLVEVEGVSDPGGFAPILVVHRLRKLGTGRVPEPRRVTYEQLLAGGLDAQWVEIAGIVRTVEPMPGDARKSRLELAAGGGRLDVQVHAPLAHDAYVDAEVRLRGLCFNQHNANRQILSPLLLVPRGVSPVVDAPPRAYPPSAHPLAASGLLQFSSQGTYGHRVHVRGIVTHQRPGEFLWIRDGGRGLRVQSRQRETLRAGDEVDVLGFPARGEYTPILEDAVFRKRGSRRALEPVRLRNIAEALRHDANLVEVEARLLEIRPVQDGWTLALDWRGSHIEAFAPFVGQTGRGDWRAGGVVSVSGICTVLTRGGGPLSGVWEPNVFKILLRSPQDLTLVKAPPWWTKERVIGLLGGVAVCSLLAIVAVWMGARRRLREQAARRARAEVEFTAILAERNRIAREIHDTLAQGLGAISMHLELVAHELNGTSHPAVPHLETAHQLVRQSLADARQSIWNMRSQVLENNDLAGALGSLVRQLANGTGVDAGVRVIGRPRRLPPRDENNLLRIAQEAVVNAIKHAQPQRIEVSLEFCDKHARLSVRDDGTGFDPARPAAREAFGLIGMRERTEQLRSRLAVHSEPGRGTEIDIDVPLPGLERVVTQDAHGAPAREGRGAKGPRKRPSRGAGRSPT